MDISLMNTIRGCALRNYPNEMVGVVVNDTFLELKNVANRPESQYSLSPRDKLILFEMGDSLQALVHSHPSLNNTPSDFDLKSQKSCGFPFWIIGTDGKTCTSIKEVDNG